MEVVKVRRSLRLQKSHINKARTYQIERVNYYKETGNLKVCSRAEASLLCGYGKENDKHTLIDDLQVYNTIEYFQFGVLQRWNNLKDFLKSLLPDLEKTFYFRDYAQFQVMINYLFDNITFDKTEVITGNKLFAIISGSFPAHLAGSLEHFHDIDIFLVINSYDKENLKLATKLITVLRKIEFYLSGRRANPYTYKDGDVYAIATVGKLQFIARDFSGCYFHMDSLFFKDFHHATRWKLVVRNCEQTGKQLISTRYIPHNKKILAQKISLHPELIDEYGNLDFYEYPSKHCENQTLKGKNVPSLVQLCVIFMEQNIEYKCTY